MGDQIQKYDKNSNAQTISVPYSEDIPLNLVQKLVIFGCILCSKTVYYEAYGFTILSTIFTFILLLTIALFAQSVRINYKKLFYALFILLIVAINPSAKPTSVIIMFVFLLGALLVTSIVNIYQFCSFYPRILRVVILFSLLSFVIIRFNIPSPLPAAKSIADFYYRNFIFFFVPERNIEAQAYRASGLWWEPGAFQVFINIAFFCEIVINKVNRRNYIIYAIGVLSTFSTTGFAVFALLSFVHFRYAIKKLSFVQLLGIFSIVILILIAIIFFAQDILFGKLNQDDSNFVSTLTRVYDNMIDWTMFQEHYLLGIGWGNDDARVNYALKLIGPLEYDSPARPTGSDGLLFLAANIGIGSLFLILPLLFPKYLKRFTFAERLVIALGFFFMFNTENLTYTIFFYMLVLWSFIKPPVYQADEQQLQDLR